MADKVTKVIAWFVQKRAMIKFEGDEESMTIAESVIAKTDFAKSPLLKGDTVEITVEGEEIVSIAKVKGKVVAEKKAEPVKDGDEKKVAPAKEEKAEEPVVEGTELTKEVYCVSKYGLKFVGDTSWTNFTDELQKKDFKSIGIVAKNTITVVIKDGKIVEVKKVDVVKKEEAPATEEKTTSTKKSSWRDEESTDKRTASMNAKDVVVALINSGRTEVDSDVKINDVIDGLIKKFYEATKSL